MKMLNLLKLAVVAGLVTFYQTDALAQGGYSKVSAGYSIGTGYLTGANRTGNNVELEMHSPGKGLNTTISGGYMFDPNFGLELGIGYLFGSKGKQIAKTTLTAGGGSTNIKEEFHSYSRFLMVKPAFVVSAGRQGLNPYSAFGPLIAKGKLHDQYFQTGSTEIERHIEYKGGLAIGAHGAFGLNLNNEKSYSLFAEITINSISYAPQKGEVTKMLLGGNDRIADMSVNDREAEYVEELDLEAPMSKDKPTQFLKTSYSLSSIGLNAGIRFKL